MKKPFSTAYDAIKKLIKNIFGKKEDGAEAEAAVEETAEAAGAVEEAAEEAEEAVKEEVKPEVKEEPAKKPEKKAEKKPEKKPAEQPAKKAEEKPAQKPAQKQTQKAAPKAQKTSNKEQEEQKKYEAEVKRRAERAARREQEEKKKEAAAAAREAYNNEKTAIDPVTGEEVPLGSLPEEATYLKKYMRIPTTADDIIVAMNSIIKHPDMPKNIVILGRNGFGTVKVGEDFARSFYSLGIVKSDKIAKTKAKQLNKMSLDSLKKLQGGCLIIENAGLVSFDKLVEVIRDSQPQNNDYVVILTGEIDSLANFFEENGDIVDQFIYLIDVHKIKERGMMHIARGYVKEKGYKADKPVFDRLKESLKTMEEGNIDRFVGLMDEVMERCDKRESEDGISGKEIQTNDI